MTRRIGPLLAPFDEKGNLLQYVAHQKAGIDRQPKSEVRKNWDGVDFTFYTSGIFWKPREPFVETFHFKNLYSGRSALGVIWETDDGRTFPMFNADFQTLLTLKLFDKTITGTWVVRKYGANYGVMSVLGGIEG
jgi:hypothetical protein